MKTFNDFLEFGKSLPAKGFKHCICCHRILPFVEFNKRVKAYDGYNARCKKCVSIRRYDIDAVDSAIINRHTKICLACGVNIPIEQFMERCSITESYMDGRFYVCNPCMLRYVFWSRGNYRQVRREHAEFQDYLKHKWVLLEALQKMCSWCHEVLSLSEFLLRAASEDGFTARCKNCIIDFVDDKIKTRTEKLCLCCGNLRVLNDFYKINESWDKLSNVCNGCWSKWQNNKTKNWNESNPEKRKITVKRHYINNRDKILANYHANKENILTRRKEIYYGERHSVIRKYMKDYNKQHPEYQRAGRIRRRSRLGGSKEHDLSADGIKALLKYQDYKCKYCLDDVTDGYHLDHVIPVAKGGPATKENIVAACGWCNQSKGDKILYKEWIPIGYEILLI